MSAAIPKGLAKGARVKIPSKGMEGLVHFVGATKFATGHWVGIELEEPKGKHNGTLKGEKYFECPKMHGMFARVTQVKIVTPAPADGTATSPTKRVKSGGAASTSPTKSPTKVSKKAAPAEDDKIAAADRNPDITTTSTSTITTATADKNLPTTMKASASTTKISATTTKAPAAAKKVSTATSKTMSAVTDKKMTAPSETVKTVKTAPAPVSASTSNSDDTRALTLQLNKCKAQAIADQRKIKSLQESLELADLDKEVYAEESRDLKEQLADLKMELQSGGGGGDLALPSGDGSDLATENIKLKKAVVRLRDAFSLAQSDLVSARDMLKRSGSGGGGAGDDESLVDALSEKNIELEMERTELEMRCLELTDLLTVTDKVSDAATMSEKEASAELESAYDEILNLEAVVSSLESKNADYRKAVAKMRTQLDAAKKDLAAAPQQQPEAPQDGGVANANVDGATNKAAVDVKTMSNKERANGINQLIHDHNRMESDDHLKMLGLFLPDTFVTTEEGGILLVLLLKRIRAKCEILLQDTMREFRLHEDLTTLLHPDTSRGVTLDQLSFAQYLVGCLSSVKVSVTVLLKGLERGDDVTYRTLSHNYVEIKGHEAGFDELLEMIKKDGLGPSVSLEKIRLASHQFDRLITQHVSTTNETTSKEFSDDFFNLTPIYITSLSLELSRLQEMFKHTTSEGEKDPAFDNLLARLGEWVDECGTLKKLCRKAWKFSNSPAEGSELLFPAEIRRQLTTGTLSILRNVVEGIRDTCKAVWTHTHSSATLKALQVDSALKIAQKQLIDLSENGDAMEAAKSAGAEAGMIPQHVTGFMASVQATLSTLLQGLEIGKFDTPSTESMCARPPPPWEVRGTQMKNNIAESLGYKAKFEDKIKEVAEAKKITVAKERQISEMKVKLAASVKLADTVKHEESRTLSSLKEKLDALELAMQQERADFEKERIALEDEIRDIDGEREALKKKYELDKPTTLAAVGDLRAAGLQIYALRQALHKLRVDLSQERGRSAQVSLGELTALPVETLQKQKSLAKENTEVMTLLRNLKMATACPVMVDITKKSPITTPTAPGVAVKRRMHPASQVSVEAARLHVLRHQGHGVVHRAHASLANSRHGARANVSFGTFQTPQFKRALGEAQSGIKSASITIPKAFAATGSAGIVRMAVNTAQFQAIHAEMAK